MDRTAGESAPVRLIEHSDGKEFGTGFAVLCDHEATWLVTCAHVVDTREGETLVVGGRQAEVVANGRDEGRERKIDLAVVRVPGLRVAEVLSLAEVTSVERGVRIPGWYEHVKGTYRSDCLEATIVKGFPWIEQASTLVARAFDLMIEHGGLLDKGYSGAPVICREMDAVVAVVATHKEPGTSGSAICISHLWDIWREMPAELLADRVRSELAPTLRSSPGNGRRLLLMEENRFRATMDLKARPILAISPASALSATRRRALQQALEQLTQQYEAALMQSVNAVDAVSQLKAEQQAQQIAARMENLQRQLRDLKPGSLP